MCTEVVLGDNWVDNCGELMVALGCQIDDFVQQSPVVELTRDDCLCCVDIEATAAKFGYKVDQNWKTGCGEWVFKKAGE